MRRSRRRGRGRRRRDRDGGESERAHWERMASSVPGPDVEDVGWAMGEGDGGGGRAEAVEVVDGGRNGRRGSVIVGACEGDWSQGARKEQLDAGRWTHRISTRASAPQPRWLHQQGPGVDTGRGTAGGGGGGGGGRISLRASYFLLSPRQSYGEPTAHAVSTMAEEGRRLSWSPSTVYDLQRVYTVYSVFTDEPPTNGHKEPSPPGRNRHEAGMAQRPVLPTY